MAFQRFASPTLPTPPEEYEESYFMNLIRSLGSYFSIHDSKAGLNIDSVISDFIQLPIGAMALSNSANHNIALPKKSFARITGPSTSFSITGIQGGEDGKIAILYNTTANAMTIANANAGSTAANQIITNTGSDVATTSTGIVSLIYSVTDSRWILLSVLT
jgi:hypothetical protein